MSFRSNEWEMIAAPKDFESCDQQFREAEREAEKDRVKAAALAGTMAREAEQVEQSRPTFARLERLRAMRLMTIAGMPIEPQSTLVEKTLKTLDVTQPAHLDQRCEIYAALAATAKPDLRISYHSMAAAAFLNLGHWQLQHNYLQQAQESAERAMLEAAAAGRADQARALEELSDAIRWRTVYRERYQELGAKISAHPEDAALRTQCARLALLGIGDVAVAAEQGRDSDDPLFQALWTAHNQRALRAPFDVAVALAALADHGSDEFEKHTMARLALGQIREFRLSEGTVDQSDVDRLEARMRTVAGLPAPATRRGAATTAPARIAYVCDASGSMIQAFDTMRGELRRMITKLQEQQSLNVIFFQEREKTMALSAGEMLAATETNKAKAIAFINSVSPHGETNPIPAMELAFRRGAQVIYFFSDGDYPDAQASLLRCRELNAEKRVAIHTILLAPQNAPPDELRDAKEVLLGLAEDNLGTFTVLPTRSP